MASVKIRIGASTDTSVATAFTQFEQAATKAAARAQQSFNRATTAMQRDLARAGRGMAKEMGTAGAAADAAMKRAGKSGADAMKGIRSGSVEAAKATRDLAGAMATQFGLVRQMAQSLPGQLHAVTAAANQALKAANAVGRSAGRGGGDRGAGPGRGERNRSNAWGGALTAAGGALKAINPLGFGMGAAAFGARAAIGLASDIGVETDIGKMFGRNVEDEAIAQKVSNAGYMPGQDGPNGRVVHSDTLLQESRQTAINTGHTRGDVLGAMQEFVGKTGDLDLARQIIEKMGRMATATGADFTEMASASAEVANVLGDIPNKGDAVEAVMRQIAGQGKLGAVEVRDLASQMAKIAGVAGQFEGGVEKNIATLGVMTQMAKLRGTATSATMAATSTSSFVSMFSTRATVRKWKAAKINPFTDDSETTLRDPMQLVRDLLTSTKGNKEQLGALVPNKMAMREILGWQSIYKEAGGGTEGIEAVNREFERLSAAQLTETEITRAFNAEMEKTKNKTTVFNEKMAAVAEQLAGVLLPALESFAPAVIDAAEGLTKLAAKLLGVDLAEKDRARKASERKDEQEALQKEFDIAKGKTWAPGEKPTLAINQFNGQLVPAPAGVVNQSHIDAVSRGSIEMGAEIAKEELDLKKYKAEHGYKLVNQTVDVKQPDGSTHKVYGVVRGQFEGYSDNEQAEINKRENELSAMKEQQVRTNQLLEQLNQGLMSGLVRAEMPASPPAVPTGGVTPPNSGGP